MPADAPPSLRAIADRVADRLDEVLTAELDRWRDFDPDLCEPMDEIGRLVRSGGKRLRPAFCYWGHVGAGGDPDDSLVIDAGAAIELMHGFALFHDDVMDDAATRRGQPTTHSRFAARHAEQGWGGESRRFGEGIAILVGDLAFVYADRLLTGVNQTVWEIWNELRIELNVGQVLDIVGTVRGVRGPDQADRICRYKSGKYTIERPLHLGVALRSPERFEQLAAQLSAYGLPLGDAFQMRDDVMGAFGDPATTGKPVGVDLREGKPTPMLARARVAASPSQLHVLDRVGRAGLGDDEVADIQQVLVDTGALACIEQMIGDRTDDAVAAIRRSDLVPEAVAELVAIAEFVSDRTV